MITPVTFYAATCDNCGKEWRDDHHGWSAMNDENAIKECLADDDWYSGDTKSGEGKDGEHYCPDCWSMDDDDKFHLKAIKP